MEELLHKDKVSRKIMAAITLLSIVVASVDLVFGLMDTFKNLSDTLSSSINSSMLIMYILGVAADVGPSTFQFVVSIKCFKTNAKEGSYDNAGQTALLCTSILLTATTALVEEIINLVIYESVYMSALKPFIVPILALFVIFGLSSFVKYNVIQKRFKSLKFLQLIIAGLCIAYFAIYHDLLITFVDDNMFAKLCYFANIGILLLLVLESCTALLYLAKNRNAINQLIYADSDRETIKIVNNNVTEKVYIARGEKKSKYTTIAYIFGIVYILAMGVYIGIELVNNWRIISDVINLDAPVYTLMIKYGINVLNALFIVFVLFSYLKASYAYIFNKKYMQTAVTTAFTFVNIYQMYTMYYGNMGSAGYMAGIFMMIGILMLSIFNKWSNNIYESLQEGEAGEDVTRSLMFMNLCSSIIILLTSAFMILYIASWQNIAILIAGIMVIALSSISLKHPREEYFIRTRKYIPQLDDDTAQADKCE
ncbi:MAG: hypothetical protein J6C90_01290 [Clostridia bacterium]|nr:hypothetical protein [Clostridia bacterium]